MDLTSICTEVQLLAKEVGSFINAQKQDFTTDLVEKKGKNDFVSYVDKSAEEQIVKGLRLIIPEAGYITEEGTASSSGERYKWVIDPLDGTTNFIHGFSPHAVSIALLDGDETVLGVVYEISHDEMFAACKNMPAILNGKPIKVSNAAGIEDALVITGFPYTIKERADLFMEALKYLMFATHGLRRTGSAATDLCYVASGRAEMFFEMNLNAWDVAAGAFILQQAGGRVSDFKGGSDYLFGREIIAANSGTFEAFQQVMKRFFVDMESA